MTVDLIKRLKETAKDLNDWEEIRTSIKGVSIVKLPKGGDYNLSIKIIPVDDDGNPMKRKGLFVTSFEQWDAFKDVFANDKVEDLIRNIDELKNLQKPESDEENKETFKV